MLNKISIHNFKCFGDLEMPLKSVNILTGMNGVGKSTIIQSLLLLRQSFFDYRLKKGLILKGQFLNLGTGHDVLYEKAEEDETIRFQWEEDREQLAVSFEYEEASNILPLESMAGKMDKSVVFSEHFVYLSANRIAPKLLYNIGNKDDMEKHFFGNDGEYAIQYLKEYGSNEVNNANVLLENAKGTDIKNQVAAWMDTISPGVDAIIEIDNANRSSKLNYEFIEGKNKSNSYKCVNVGFGITYVLPVVVALVSASKGDLVIIENPEAHVHPAGQSMLGQLIAKAGAGEVQVIVETHSDHIINGMRWAVRQQYINKLDTNIVFFYKDKEDDFKHKYISPKINDEGQLDIWPEGFFDEWDKIEMALL